MKTWRTSAGTAIHRLSGGQSHAYLVARGGHALLVDTGRRLWRRLLLGQIRQAGISGIDALILTHAHFDHAENAASLRERFGLRIIVHASEAPLLARGENPPVEAMAWPARLPARFFARHPWLFRYRPAEPDLAVEGLFDLSPLGIDGFILPTPGHTAGSLSVIVENEIALAGDALFGVFPRSVLPPFGQSLPQIVASWRLLIDTGCRLFLPAHGGPLDRDQLSIHCPARGDESLS